MADVLEQATASVRDVQPTDPTYASLVHGVRATEKNLLKVFASHGVEPFGKLGDKFDPNRHEALMQVPDASKEPNSIAILLRKGWSLNNRVMRPAQVGTVIAVPGSNNSNGEKKDWKWGDDA